MGFLLSSQPVPQPRPSPPLSNADVVDLFLAVVTNPLFFFFVFLMLYCLRICFIRFRGNRRIYPVPEIETEAANLDNDHEHDHDHDRVHPSPSDDDSATAYAEEQMLKEADVSFVFDKSLIEEAGVVLKGNINECVICLEDIKDGEIARVLPVCTHIFHKACIELWFMKRLVCPICRATPYHSS